MKPLSFRHRFGGMNTYNMIHVTLQKWDSIPIDFLEVALKIKDFEVKCRRLAIMHGRTPVKYSIILHGKRGSGKANCIYQHGCFIYYRPDGSFRISKVNRKSKAFLAMLKTARYFGGEIETQEQEQITKEGKILSKKQLEIRKRVLKNYKGFVSI